MSDRKTSTLAIISLVAGIVSWIMLPVLASLGAIITGHMARGEIRRSGGTIDGDGMAVIGLVLGWASLIVSILAVVIVFMFFGGLIWFASMAS